MGQPFKTRERSTISVASTAWPKSTSLSMQNFLASPCLPSNISCWNFVSFVVIFASFDIFLVQNRCNSLRLVRDRDGGLLADRRRVDLDHVASLDSRDRV